MAELNFAVQAYQTRSTQLLAQQAINCFVEPTPKEGKTQSPVYGTPGLSLFSRMGNGPINGMHLMNNDLFILSGGALYTIPYSEVQGNTTGQPVAATLIGQTGLGGLVSMADNGTQLMMVNSAGWIYQPGGLNVTTTVTQPGTSTTLQVNLTGTVNSGDTLNIPLDSGAIFIATATETTAGGDGVTLGFTPGLPSQVTAGAIVVDPANQLARIVAEAYSPAAVVRYFDGYFVLNAIGTRQFFLSAINDGTQYSGLDYATATAGSDPLIGLEIYHEQLLLLCQLHTEIWWDAGNVTFPFQRYDAALIARGLAAPYCVCSEDNTMFWMGEDGLFYRLNGFSPERISTFAMEHAWAQYPLRFTDASCFVLDQEGHKFVIVNFPSGNQTWAYDIGTKLWAQRISYGTRWV
jgi:hypothetical protein